MYVHAVGWRPQDISSVWFACSPVSWVSSGFSGSHIPKIFGWEVTCKIRIVPECEGVFFFLCGKDEFNVHHNGEELNGWRPEPGGSDPKVNEEAAALSSVKEPSWEEWGKESTREKKDLQNILQDQFRSTTRIGPQLDSGFQEDPGPGSSFHHPAQRSVANRSRTYLKDPEDPELHWTLRWSGLKPRENLWWRGRWETAEPMMLKSWRSWSIWEHAQTV